MNRSEVNTLIVIAREEGFRQVFLREQCWYAVRMSESMAARIQFVAAYRTKPVCAITHWAPVRQLVKLASGKYLLVFATDPVPLKRPVPFGDAPRASMRSPRYAVLRQLFKATQLTELLGMTPAR